MTSFVYPLLVLSNGKEYIQKQRNISLSNTEKGGYMREVLYEVKGNNVSISEFMSALEKMSDQLQQIDQQITKKVSREIWNYYYRQYDRMGKIHANADHFKEY